MLLHRPTPGIRPFLVSVLSLPEVSGNHPMGGDRAKRDLGDRPAVSSDGLIAKFRYLDVDRATWPVVRTTVTTPLPGRGAGSLANPYLLTATGKIMSQPGPAGTHSPRADRHGYPLEPAGEPQHRG